MTEKRFKVEKVMFDGYCIVDDNVKEYYAYEKHDLERLCDSLNELVTNYHDLEKENEQLKQVIAENEKLIQSTYEELTKLRCIKKNLSRIKTQWDWIMEVIQYD